MTIGEIIKCKDKETYYKLLEMSGNKERWNKYGKKMDETKCRRIY